MARLVREHSFLCAAAALALLTTGFLNSRAFSRSSLPSVRLNLVEQQFSCDESIQSLLSRLLTFDLCASRPVQQHYARSDLVDILSAMTAGADEGFFDVSLLYTQSRHTLREL